MKNNSQAKLIEGDVPRQLIYLTLPMIMGVLGMVLFNLADALFVGRLGSEQLAALTFTFPVVLAVNSLSAGIGMGSSALVSRYVGEQNHYKVERLTTDTLGLGILLIFLVAVTGLLTITPLFSLLGAEGIVLEYVKEYMSIWYLGVTMVVIPMIGNNIIRGLGDTKTPGIVMAVGATINFILDPLLIFGIGIFPAMGVRGAALATVFARAITALVAIYVLHFREGIISFQPVKIREIIVSWKEVLYIGIPVSFIRMAMPIGTGIITRLVSTYGTAAVAGFGVATRVEFFALAPIVSLAVVMGPFTGQNLGAGRFDRVMLGRETGSMFSLICGTTLALLLALLARPIAALFNNNPQVIETTVLYLRIVPLSYGLQGVLQIAATILNVLNKPFHASGLMIIQIFVLYVPLAYLGSRLFGLAGIFASLALSNLVAGVMAHFEVKKQIGNYTKQLLGITAV